MFIKNKTRLAIIPTTILIGWMALAQSQRDGDLFAASGFGAVSSDKTFQSVKNEAIENANKQCLPNESKRVSEWDYEITKAGYLDMIEVTAIFICVKSEPF